MGDRLELIDSGFRRGSDRHLRGNGAWCPGRTGRRGHVDRLAAAAEVGVRLCIDILAQELHTTMHLCDARSIAELNRGMIRSRQPWPPAGAHGWSAACSQARAPSTAGGHHRAESVELAMVIGWCTRCDARIDPCFQIGKTADQDQKRKSGHSTLKWPRRTPVGPDHVDKAKNQLWA